MALRCVPPDLRRLDDASAELIACGVWEDERPMRGLAGLLDWRLAGRLSKLAREGFLRGAVDEALFVPGKPRLAFEKVILLGLGPRKTFDDEVYRRSIARFASLLDGLNVERAVIELPGRCDGAITPERAVDLLFEGSLGARREDAWVLVEDSANEKRIAARAKDEKRLRRRS